METIHTKHIHFPVAIELRCLGIPTSWTVREEKISGERVLFPSVSQNVERRLARIDTPDEIRTQFLKLKLDETSALEFLNGVGVWSAVENMDGGTGLEETYMIGAFGHRHLIGRALPVELGWLWRQQERWRGLLRNKAKLRAEFGVPPSRDSRPIDKDVFALNARFGNTLPVHLEWLGKHPRAIVQPITGEEILIALAWLDVVTGAEFKVCQKCGVAYTRGGRQYCTLQCQRAHTMRTYRINLKKKKSRRG
jgi:hypothetical protein